MGILCWEDLNTKRSLLVADDVGGFSEDVSNGNFLILMNLYVVTLIIKKFWQFAFVQTVPEYDTGM
jgi:hypothetical protein